jgi:KDO2-lipid IV(A) lauroyltransferase
MLAVSGHLSCFDMVLLTLAQYGYPIQGLSYANPHGSYLVQNAIRIRSGLDLTPITPQALRTALHRLRNGGIAMTAVDRPVEEGEMLELCGRAARLPVGHARLAIMARARVMVAVCQSAGGAKYRVVPGEILDSTAYEKRGDGPKRLAQDVIKILEPFIRSRPGEWMMFYPLWPDVQPGAAP